MSMLSRDQCDTIWSMGCLISFVTPTIAVMGSICRLSLVYFTSYIKLGMLYNVVSINQFISSRQTDFSRVLKISENISKYLCERLLSRPRDANLLFVLSTVHLFCYYLVMNF